MTYLIVAGYMVALLAMIVCAIAGIEAAADRDVKGACSFLIVAFLIAVLLVGSIVDARHPQAGETESACLQ